MYYKQKPIKNRIIKMLKKKEVKCIDVELNHDTLKLTIWEDAYVIKKII